MVDLAADPVIYSETVQKSYFSGQDYVVWDLVHQLFSFDY